MVYFGCGTAPNRCAWALCVCIALAGASVFCAGAGRMWVCNHQPGSSTTSSYGFDDAPASCRLRAGVMMAVGPLVVVLGVVPCLLFFASCMAVPPPPPLDWAQGVPSSPVTVVRGGVTVSSYDAQGKLLSSPDCYRAVGGRPLSLPPSPASKAAGYSNSAASSPVQGPGPLHAGRKGGGAGGSSGDGSCGSDAGTAEVHITLQQLPSRHAPWQQK